MVNFQETQFGFEWGAVTIERNFSGPPGWVHFTMKTPKTNLSVYVTKTGKIRIYDGDREINLRKEENE
jgi:hypothetical protein